MMKLKTRILAGIAAVSISAVTMSAFAQVPPPGGPHGRAPSPEQVAKFEQMRAKHQAELHDKLKITAAQEAGWKLFLDKTKPAPFDAANRPKKEDWEKLTTPQRLDKKLEMMRKRESFAEQRIAATKDFYATLSPEQQKTFDVEFSKMERHRFEHFQHGKKGPHGEHRGQKPGADAPPPPPAK